MLADFLVIISSKFYACWEKTKSHWENFSISPPWEVNLTLPSSKKRLFIHNSNQKIWFQKSKLASFGLVAPKSWSLSKKKLPLEPKLKTMDHLYISFEKFV